MGYTLKGCLILNNILGFYRNNKKTGVHIMKLYIRFAFFLLVFGFSDTYSNHANAVEMGFSPEVVKLGDSLAGPGIPLPERVQMYSFLQDARGDKKLLVELVNGYVGPAAAVFDKIDSARTLALVDGDEMRARLVSQCNDLLPEGTNPHAKVHLLNSMQQTPVSRREKMVNVAWELFHPGLTLRERAMIIQAMKRMPENQIMPRYENTSAIIEAQGPEFVADGGTILQLMRTHVYTEEELAERRDAQVRRARGHFGITGTEAIVGRGGENKRKIISAYRKIASKPHIRELLPEKDMVDALFLSIAQELKRKFEIISIMNWPKSKRKSILAAAERGLEVLEGARKGHAISSAAAYRGTEFNYDADIPSIWALFVLAYRLHEPSSSGQFVKAWLAEDPIRWAVAKRIFADNFPKVTGHKTLGEALMADKTANGGKFIKTLADAVNGVESKESSRMNIQQARFAKRLAQDYRNKVFEDLMPMIEMLFMVVRGHNVNLEDMTEKDKPACAEGAQLGLLRIIAENPEVGEEASRLLAGVTVESCTIL